jgi:hypothetical protein
MASKIVHQEFFRFLNLPQELRYCVYENIKFSTTWHVLDRAQAILDKREWPFPPKAQVQNSRVTLIRPYTGSAIEILATCRLIREEACHILKRKIDHARLQPVRYLVDYSAAWALVSPLSALRSCLGVPDGGDSRRENEAVRAFLRICAVSLSRTRLAQNGIPNKSRRVQTIEMTITHQSDLVYGIEVFETVMSFSELRYFGPTRLVIVYQSPLPRVWIKGDTQARDLRHIEGRFLQQVPRELEPSSQASSCPGIFVKPREEAAFEKHVTGLESC